MKRRKIGRNDPCYCGSGKKYKNCHGLLERASRGVEAVKVGYSWIQNHTNTLIQTAQQNSTKPLSDSLSKALIEICDHQSGEWINELDLPAQGKKGREQIGFLKHAFQSSVVEPFEVIEVRRGFDLKIQGQVSGKTYTIAQPDDAEKLEPMEWVMGRVLIFQKRAYLLPEWSKIPFKKRRWLCTQIENRWNESGLDFNLPFSRFSIDEASDSSTQNESETLSQENQELQNQNLQTWLKDTSLWFFDRLEEAQSS